VISPREASAALGYIRAVIAERLGGPPASPPRASLFTERLPNFVTVHRGPRLQGCIGTMAPDVPLAESLRRNALAAAFDDPRGRPLRAIEVPALSLEVSILSPLEPLPLGDEAHALTSIRPGVDGLLLSWRGHRGVFLPQVWRSLPEPPRFLQALKEKAGLPRDFWADDVELERFTVTEFHQGPLSRYASSW
jgi:AmmeMemoRadiSam system protein A